MAMYRDSALGLCLDITGPDGNIYVIWAYGSDLARQLDQVKEWEDTVEAAKSLSSDYLLQLNVFKEFFPIVTLVGYDEVVERESD
jgi:hypothetical protein